MPSEGEKRNSGGRGTVERHPLDSSPSNSSSGSLQPPISYRQSPGGNDRLQPIYRVLLFAGLAVFLIFLANALVPSIGSAPHNPEQWSMPGAPPAAFYAWTRATRLQESCFFLRTIDRRRKNQPRSSNAAQVKA